MLFDQSYCSFGFPVHFFQNRPEDDFLLFLKALFGFGTSRQNLRLDLLGDHLNLQQGDIGA